MLKNMSSEQLKNTHKSVENLLHQTTLGRDGGVKSFMIDQETNFFGNFDSNESFEHCSRKCQIKPGSKAI
jgi:hypothetical protein